MITMSIENQAKPILKGMVKTVNFYVKGIWHSKGTKGTQ